MNFLLLCIKKSIPETLDKWMVSKGKVYPCACQEAIQEGREGIAPLIPNLGTRYGDCPASCSSRFTPGTQWEGGWVGPRAGLDKLENRCMGMEPQFLHQPAHSLVTIPLIYPGSNRIKVKCKLTLMPCHLEMALSGRSARRVRRDLNTFRFSFSSISKLNTET
jgi:hypothetical protein